MMLLMMALLPLFANAEPNLPTEISSIYTYQCTRTFLEGEGVDFANRRVDCPIGQKLGLIEADYTYALYHSPSGNNFDRIGRKQNYESALCERETTKLDCSRSAPKLQFGLSSKPEGIFQVAVTMMANPTDSDATSIYGYAALTDRYGNCPAGLVKINQAEAQAESIDRPLPSTFVNEANNLNNKLIAVKGQPLPEFKVFRRANSKPCDERGSCRGAEFSPKQKVRSAAYTYLSPTVCAIPESAIH